MIVLITGLCVVLLVEDAADPGNSLLLIYYSTTCNEKHERLVLSWLDTRNNECGLSTLHHNLPRYFGHSEISANKSATRPRLLCDHLL